LDHIHLVIIILVFVGWGTTNRIVSTQLDIVGLWRFIGMHRCYNLLQHNELALSRN